MTSISFDPQRADLTLGIVGTGMMGRGIAQIAAQAGIRVLLYDADAKAAPAARDYVATTLGKLAEKGKLTAEQVQGTVSRIEVAPEPQALSPCHVLIEAIVEKVEVKRALFAELERVVSEQCVLASNTSTLKITAIAAACKHPGRVAGYHFFNPVPLMKIVEVVDGALTAPAVCDSLAGLAKRMGHRPVRAKDTPGFIVNHAGRGFGPEALRIVGEGIASFAEVDRILREGAGFRMGPFELFDLVGLDVSHAVMESIYHQYYQEARYRPSPMSGARVTAGLYGRKSGRGFYGYAEGKLQAVPVAAAPKWNETAQPAVWISSRDLGGKLKGIVEKFQAKIDGGAKPASGSLCLVAPLGTDATTSALAEGLDPQRTVAVDCLFSLEKHRTLMTTPVTRVEIRDAAHALLSADGVPVTLIHDSPGFVCQRVLAQIINIAADIAQQRIASPEDIDSAVTLGLGYPRGPLAWGDELGPDRVLKVLNALFEFYGDPRYRASPWLKRRALLGVSLLTPEG